MKPASYYAELGMSAAINHVNREAFIASLELEGAPLPAFDKALCAYEITLGGN